ncbi:calcium-binding protein [Roseibium denhamense]|uniref:Ca2+-binding protein, EF-hand superfamily n=1 Tax=Roseibium denhamense TaxID=76305 RepID=A0ABY1N6D6_9HYPH|nr:EF-hand domain-containing protein [Roseibium denhamense]MTI06058.1 calcium-binding protein [Roseibium denhamense]SMP01629.1 Ca2+-binding protein, EF-hand superfamily [Roseibium denhamense]
MKPFKKIAIAALAASVAGTALMAGVPASAQNGGADRDGGQNVQQTDQLRMAHKKGRGDDSWGRGHGRGGSERVERLFERFDADQDGSITAAEIESVRSDAFTSADTDGDGVITLDEFKAEFLNRSNDRMIRAFQRMDRDGDGTITQAEADAAANRMFNRLDRDGNGIVESVRSAGGEDRGERRGRRGGQGAMFMGLFDADGNGSVSREEFDAKRAELFALADTSGSGSFTLEEFGPLWTALNEQRIVKMFQRADADGSLGLTAEEHGRQADHLMERADRNKDGVISKADFSRSGKGKHGGHGKGGDHKRG